MLTNRDGLHLARIAADSSHDPKTKVGCTIISGVGDSILAVGANRFPRGVQPILENKYEWMLHAEQDAIAYAAANGMSLCRAHLFCNGMVCNHCAALIVQARIARVIIPVNHVFLGREDWEPKFEIARTILSEGGVLLQEENF